MTDNYKSLKDSAKNYNKQALDVLGINEFDLPELRSRFYNLMTKKEIRFTRKKVDCMWSEIKILLFVKCQQNHKKLETMKEDERRMQLVVWYARAMLEVVDYTKHSTRG